ncbi:MAG TPA: pyridoxamine 5'-phosphate oxidase family protein [Acidimicrobiales bacterium]|jgi:nitroimidazol reductase NimA-like FMN-containing flavoprotein (pyridoxamine 5'-phosphate oxidase superfamily)
MSEQVDDLGAVARAIIDANLYMTLGTADGDGRPWVSPVYFAPAEYREFVWVSHPWAQHSRNLAVRPEVGIVIFDSTAPISTGQAVYMAAVAEELQAADDVARYIEVFSRSSEARGGSPWSPDDVRPGTRHRLFRATASDHWILDEHDERVPVAP